jgi:lipoprotein-anchoring transpeptidase ErfK/SrfK
MKTKVTFIILILVLIAGISIWFLVYRPQAYEKKIEAAVKLAAAGDCRGAVPILEELLSPASDTSAGREVRLLLARCRSELSNYREALPLWEEIVTWDDPLSGEEAEFYLGWIAKEEGDQDKAREDLTSYLRRYPDSPRSARARLALARINAAAGELSESRELFLEVLESSDNVQVTNQARQELGTLNFTIFFSPEIYEDSQTYTVRSGDSLTTIARAYNTTPDLVKKMNRIRGEIIHPGQVLKVPAHRFSAIVSKSLNTLQLLYGEVFFKEYSVGTGRNNCSPTGEFAIVTKLVDPPWIHGGETIPPFDPRNILGTRWMGFDDPYASFGIHGTTMPETVGSQSSDGCVRMINEQAEELFIFLPRGSKVIIEE